MSYNRLNRRSCLQLLAGSALAGAMFPPSVPLWPGWPQWAQARPARMRPWSLGTAVQYYRSDLVASSGGFADTWSDRTPNALHLVQAGAPRPAFNSSDADYGGRASLSITGSQYMDAPVRHVAQTYTWHAIGKCTNGAAVTGIIDDVTGTAGFRSVIQASTTNTRLFAGSIATIAASLLSPFWLVAEFNSTTSKLWLNGTLITSSASVGTQGVGQLRFGADASPGTFWRGSCAEMGLWSGAWPASLFSDVQRYVKDYYNGAITSGV